MFKRDLFYAICFKQVLAGASPFQDHSLASLRATAAVVDSLKVQLKKIRLISMIFKFRAILESQLTNLIKPAQKVLGPLEWVEKAGFFELFSVCFVLICHSPPSFWPAALCSLLFCFFCSALALKSQWPLLWPTLLIFTYQQDWGHCHRSILVWLEPRNALIYLHDPWLIYPALSSRPTCPHLVHMMCCWRRRQTVSFLSCF